MNGAWANEAAMDGTRALERQAERHNIHQVTSLLGNRFDRRSYARKWARQIVRIIVRWSRQATMPSFSQGFKVSSHVAPGSWRLGVPAAHRARDAAGAGRTRHAGPASSHAARFRPHGSAPRSGSARGASQAHRARSGTWTTTLSSMWLTAMPRPTRGGPARRCRPRPSGSSRRAAGWRGRVRLGSRARS